MIRVFYFLMLPLGVMSFSFTNILYKVHLCHHPRPGPLGCGPPKCTPASSLAQCKKYYSCGDGNICNFSGHSGGGSGGGSSGGSSSASSGGSSGSSSSSSSGSSSGGSDGSSSGSSSSSNGGASSSGSGTASYSNCDEGDEECKAFSDYFDGVQTGTDSVAPKSVFREIWFYIIPVIILALLVALWRKMNQKPPKTVVGGGHPLKGSLGARMKLFERVLSSKPKPPPIHSSYSESDEYTKTEEDGSLPEMDVYTKTEEDGSFPEMDVHTKTEEGGALPESDVYTKTEEGGSLPESEVYTKTDEGGALPESDVYTRTEEDVSLPESDVYTKTDAGGSPSELDVYTKMEEDDSPFDEDGSLPKETLERV